MNKLFFACAVLAACTTLPVCYARSSSRHHQLAQGEVTSQTPDQPPALRPTLPVATPAADPQSTYSETPGPKSNARAGFMDFLEDSSIAALRGAANLTDITATAHNLALCPLTRSNNPDLKYVEVTVKNEGQNIAVILGNAARADLDGKQLFPAPASVTEESDRPRLPTKGRAAVAAVSLGSVGLAAPMVYEFLTPDQHRRRSLGMPIGRDGSRFDVEATHFGIRVIMPGDQAVGWFAFACPADSNVKSLLIPVCYMRTTVPTGIISVPVAQASTN